MRAMLISLALVLSVPAGAADDDWRREVMEWREDRAEKLREPDGWLSLIGLHWLSDGLNLVGTAPDNDIVLAAGPDHVGRFEIDGANVRFCRADSGGVRIDGAERPCATMITDAEGEPTRVRIGSVTMYVIDREGRLGLRVKDTQADTRLDFAGLEYFEPDPAWRIEAEFEPFDEPRTIDVPDIVGIVQRLPSPGRVRFEKNGRTHVLDAVRYEGDDELFLIVADRTNGRQTYGGGRYLYTPLPTEEGTVTVDFNKAYNPPCVFTAHATCPLPPPQNRLDLAIEAGEKMYGPTQSDH